jgi:hypothetical protein
MVTLCFSSGDNAFFYSKQQFTSYLILQILNNLTRISFKLIAVKNPYYSHEEKQYGFDLDQLSNKSKYNQISNK